MLRVILSVSTFLLTLVACLLATVATSRGPIEQDLTKRSIEALEGIEGFRTDLCVVGFEGRDGRVQGEVKSAEIQAAAEERLRALYGARVISTEFVVRPYDAPWIMVERKSGGEIAVEGLLSDGGERSALASGLSESLPDGVVIDLRVEVKDKVEPAPWLPPLVSVAGDLLPRAEGGVVELRGGELSLRGEMPDALAEQEFVGRARERFAGAGIELEFALTLASPPEPSQLRIFPPENGEITVAGRLADLESAEKLLSLLRGSGNWIVKDQIVVEENTTPAAWVEGLSFILPSIFAEVSDAEVSIEEGRLQLDGQLESEGMFEAISELAGQNFPPSEYEIQNRLRVLVPPREAMVSVITHPDGRIQLKGLLPEAALKQRVVDAVVGAVGAELLTDELQVEANVMDANWIDPLIGLLPKYLRQVKRGGLTIYSEILAVEAMIESDADRDLIWAMTEQFFPDDKYRRILELRFPDEFDGERFEGEQIEGEQIEGEPFGGEPFEGDFAVDKDFPIDQ